MRPAFLTLPLAAMALAAAGLPAPVLAAASSTTMSDSAMSSSLTVRGTKRSGSALVIPQVTMAKPGFLVVTAMKDGKPVAAAPVGQIYLAAGTSKDVKVPVDGLAKHAEYMLALHYDTNGDGKYEFGDGKSKVDTPVMEHGKPVMAPVQTSM